MLECTLYHSNEVFEENHYQHYVLQILYVDYEQGDEGYNDFLVASVGSFVVRIKSGQTIAKGDLLQSNGIVIDPELRGDCYILSDFVAKELDDRDLPYKNSTNATVIWMVSQIREAGLLQRDICSVNNTTEQTIRGALRNILYPTLDFDKQCLSELTVEDFVSGIRTEAYRQRKKGEKE